MSILFWGLTTSVVGKVMLVVGVLKAHGEIAHEHRIDARVLKTFKIERWLTIIGLALIVIGYGMEIYFYGFTPLLTCLGSECAGSVGAILTK
tara:strand:- start:1818 stop:2093 length:276 start_codon:yes stop_codon:yes gene_type:complete